MPIDPSALRTVMRYEKRIKSLRKQLKTARVDKKEIFAAWKARKTVLAELRKMYYKKVEEVDNLTSNVNNLTCGETAAQDKILRVMEQHNQVCHERDELRLEKMKLESEAVSMNNRILRNNDVIRKQTKEIDGLFEAISNLRTVLNRILDLFLPKTHP